MRLRVVSTVAVFALFACGDGKETGKRHGAEANLSVAEAFVDAFYSFEPNRLEDALSHAAESVPSIIFYQGWAEGGNYEVVNRKPCAFESLGHVTCSITVKDDLIGALGIDFNVTDTFDLSFSDGRIVSVKTSSNDPQVFHDAKAWVRENRPELIDEPCRGFFDGGPTPGECVRAMVRGYAEFAASDDFPLNRN